MDPEKPDPKPAFLPPPAPRREVVEVTQNNLVWALLALLLFDGLVIATMVVAAARGVSLPGELLGVVATVLGFTGGPIAKIVEGVCSILDPVVDKNGS